MAGMWRYTVKFDIALALQLRSQNVLLIAEALSDIEDVTWKVIKVVSSKISTTVRKKSKTSLFRRVNYILAHHFGGHFTSKRPI